jgi:hypothetical protein
MTEVIRTRGEHPGVRHASHATGALAARPASDGSTPLRTAPRIDSPWGVFAEGREWPVTPL